MSNYRRGTIVNVDLNPTVGSETGNDRPCIIVTNDFLNNISNLNIFQVVPITKWSLKKQKIPTNVVIIPNASNGLTKKSLADCLQTRPVDLRYRCTGIRGNVSASVLDEIDQALITIFNLD